MTTTTSSNLPLPQQQASEPAVVEAKTASKPRDIKDYMELIETVARVEMSRLPNHLIDYSELVSIGSLTLHLMFTRNPEREYNVTYLSTAIKWAVRNELRNRYKWYSLRYNNDTDTSTGDDLATGADDASEVDTPATSSSSSSGYEMILSVDGLMEAENPYELRDNDYTPDERTELTELGEILRAAMNRLPERERQIIEARYFKNLKMREIGQLFNISPSRTSRIVQAALNKLKAELKRRNQLEAYIA